MRDQTENAMAAEAHVYTGLSKFGTITPKHFRPLTNPRASTELPTGVYEYKRVELRSLFPVLGKIPLSVYYRLRIACCAHMLIRGGDRLENCEVCHYNQGYVCPVCLGATWVAAPDNYESEVRCMTCCYDRLDDKGKLVSQYDQERERVAVGNWLTSRFPYGVPAQPTEADLRRMDGF